jgi:hypothetical protein
LRRTLTRIKKLAIFCHRWMGVTFCLLFAWWFVSGIFMMYCDYPSVGAEDRLVRAPLLDASRVQLSPEQAYARLELDQDPSSIRLATFDGRPLYYFRTGRDQSMVFADSGDELSEFPPEMNLRTAAAWTGQPAGWAGVEILTEPDQWTLEGNFRNVSPVEKYSWPNGEHVYISENNGEVIQYTTRSSRLFAYLGAIPHWLYFTPLRKNGPLWSKIVIWCSGIATIAALMGLIVGISMYSPSKRISIPYTGQKRLHMIFGLFFGIVACTWAFSGMLSMDPFPLKTANNGSARRIPQALRGGKFQMASYAAKPPRAALAQLGPDYGVKELEFTSFAGQPVYLATAAPNRTRIVPVNGEPAAEFDPARVLDVVTKAVQPAAIASSGLMTRYDAYYLDKHNQLPLPVLYVRLKDDSRYYIDPRTARVVGSHTSTQEAWVTRWIYHGLHSMNFPWLYNYRPAWDVVVLALMLGGTTLCVTSVMIGFQLLRRKLSFRRAT